MSVELRQSKWVVFPHRPNWETDPVFTREWGVEVSPAQSGAESRVCTRKSPIRVLEFEISPVDWEESQRMWDRYDAALSTGNALVPFWGNGLAVQTATSGDSTVTLAAPTAYEFRVGEYVFICEIGSEDHEHWEVNVVVDPLDSTTITLLNPLARTYSGPVHIYPVLLGRLELASAAQRTDWHADSSVRIRSTQWSDGSGEIPPVGGVTLTAEDDLSSYDNHGFSEVTLDGGSGWDGPWGAIEVTYDATMIEDDLSDYSAQAFDDADMNGGTGWDGKWASIYFTSSDDYGAVFWFRADKLGGVAGESYRYLPNCARAGQPVILHSDGSGMYDGATLNAGALNGNDVIDIDGQDYVNMTAEIPAEFRVLAVFADFHADDGGGGGTKALLALNAGAYTITSGLLSSPPFTMVLGTYSDLFATFFGTGTALDTAAANTPTHKVRADAMAAPMSFAVVEVVVKAGTATPRVNDSTQSSKSTHAAASVGFRIGSLGWSAPSTLHDWIAGSLAELIVTTDTTDATRDAIRADLATRWGV